LALAGAIFVAKSSNLLLAREHRQKHLPLPDPGPGFIGVLRS
jgi:hypothetical protein